MTKKGKKNRRINVMVSGEIKVEPCNDVGEVEREMQKRQ